MGRLEAGTGPLGDVRVVEMGHLLAGPFCGHLLADFGADVIKVEPPGAGDPMREWGHVKADGDSLWWPILARNKRSVTLDLRAQRGQEIAVELVRQADVLVENFRPGTLEGWGLDYDKLSRLNPGLVYIRVTGFGQDGPYARRAAYGSIGEAMGGLRHVTGDPDRPPSRVGISLGDSLAGTMAALGGMIALHARDRTGRGQIVDSAIYEAVLTYMESLIPEYQVAGHVRGRSGPILPNVAPSNVYPTADGELILVAANQDTVFGRLCECMQRPGLAVDDRFNTHSARGENWRQLDELISEWTVQHPRVQLLDLLSQSGVPAGHVYTAADMLADPHFHARDAIVRVAHPKLGQIAMQGVFPRLSDTPGQVREVGPPLGRDNDDVYRGLLGLSAKELSKLAAEGTI